MSVADQPNSGVNHSQTAATGAIRGGGAQLAFVLWGCGEFPKWLHAKELGRNMLKQRKAEGLRLSARRC